MGGEDFGSPRALAVILADTDVLIDFLRGRGAAERVALELSTGGLHTTAISAFELVAGARVGREQRAVETLLAAVTVLPLDLSGARRAGAVRRELESSGTAIGMADSLIAGTCLDRGATLLTRNAKHFERVPGLSLSRSSD